MEIIKGNLYKNPKTGLVVMADKKQNDACFSGQVIIGDEWWEKGMISVRFGSSCFQPYSAEIIIKEVIDFSKVQFIEMESGEVVFVTGTCFNEDSFAGYNIKGADFKAFWLKSEAKRVVTPKFE
jgi:hypothetical protein